MKNFKRLFLVFASFAVCFVLLGCYATQTNLALDMKAKLDRVENVIISMQPISEEDILIQGLLDMIQPVGNFMPTNYPQQNYPQPRNTDSFGNFMFNGLGYYCNGHNCYTGYNNYINDRYLNGYFNNINNHYFGNNGFFNSNIDTYMPINNYSPNNTVNSVSNVDFQQINLSNSCHSCMHCNDYCNNLKNHILKHIESVRNKANQIENNQIQLSDAQTQSIQELLKTLVSTSSKINMTKNELNTILSNVIASKMNYQDNLSVCNSKYIKLLGCMDVRNAYLQTILNSLIQIECTIDGEYCDNCFYGSSIEQTPSNNECIGGQDCVDGECISDDCVYDNNDSNTTIEQDSDPVNQLEEEQNLNNDIPTTIPEHHHPIHESISNNVNIEQTNEQEKEDDADDVVVDHIIHKTIDTDNNNSTIGKIEKPTTNQNDSSNMNSILNENEHENNKSLTA